MSGDTHHRLLDAARRLLERDGPYGARMEDIARAAGVSRQSAYLHFGSRSGLLLALVAHIDAQRDVGALVQRLWDQPDALSALDAVAELAARTNPEVHRIAMVFDAARRWDEQFEQAWQDRMEIRLRRYRRLVRWLREEKRLVPGLTIAEATSFVWTITSVSTFDQLVIERGLSLTRYKAIVRASLRGTLTCDSA